MIILRWIALLPASIASALTTYAILTLFAKYSLYAGTLGLISLDSMIGIIYKEATCSGFMGFVFVYVASQIAPSKKRIVAYCALGFLLIFTGGVLFATWLTSLYHPIKDTIGIIVSLIFCFIGAFVAIQKVKEENIE